MTTETLEDYLAGGIQRDRTDIEAVDRLLIDTANTIVSTFTGRSWPYEAKRNTSLERKDFSQSTTAMMIRALDFLLGQGGNEPHPRYTFGLPDDLRDQAIRVRGKAWLTLIKELGVTATRGKFAWPETLTTTSRTFGDNDPLTLSFLADLATEMDERTPLRQLVAGRSQEKIGSARPDFTSFFSFSGPSKDDGTETLENAFVPLRLLRSYRIDQRGSEAPLGEYVRYFEGVLHQQLSFISIPDSRFDPAELAFAVEGLNLSSGQAVDGSVFARVIEVLERAQASSAHWRPTKPFLKNKRGMVLFPVSVEAANSLLRSGEKIFTGMAANADSARLLEIIRRFWNWLRTRRVNFRCENDGREIEVHGWHSEHVNDPDTIQLWDTAQVVEFLLRYRRQLYLHVAKTSLQLSRFAVSKAMKPELPWSDDTAPAQQERISPRVKKRRLARDAAPTDEPPSLQYRNIIEQFEPVTSLQNVQSVYASIESDFVKPWLGLDGTKNYSMLLYGPPGTGKTTIARNLADALDMPLVTITVSDFLAAGGGAVEARAKSIFDVLMAQSDCVVLFDEIDELVLDRGSKRHGEQDTVFRFMTPGMLTKLNDLRAMKRLIFVLATNYAYRIDPAIRRTGRIDRSYLVLPPDLQARTKMIQKLLWSELPPEHSLFAIAEDAAQVTHIAAAATFLGFSDLKAAVSEWKAWPPTPPAGVDYSDKAIKRLKDTPRTTRLESYLAAYREVEDPEAVSAEFLPLAAMGFAEGHEARVPQVVLRADNTTPLFALPSEQAGGQELKTVREEAERYMKPSGSKKPTRPKDKK